MSVKASVWVAGALLATGMIQFLGVQRSYAQSQSAASETLLNEVVVTARKRDERLQDVPISVKVFSSEDISAAGIKRTEDFIHLTPNLTISADSGASPGQSFMTMRGLMQNRNQPPPVAVVVDGVLEVNPLEFSSGLLDIADIQVVRGPQGALYGRGAIAGAIIIDTFAPTNKTEGHVEVGAGNGGDYNVEGALSGALVEDKLFGRVSARMDDRSGYFNNINLNQKVDPIRDSTVQTRLIYVPSSNVTLDLKANLDETRSGANNTIYQPANLNPNGTLNLSNPFDPTRLNANLVETNYYANYIGKADRAIRSISLRAADTMDWATLSAVTAYTFVKEGFTSDQFPYTASRNVTIDGALIGDGVQSTYSESSALSEEIRLTSPSAQKLRWMGGAYFLANNHFISNAVLTDLGYGLVQLTQTPLYNDPHHPTISFLGDDNHDRAWALFGNADYDITDRLEFGVAIRYDHEVKRQFVSPYNTSGDKGIVDEASFSKPQPKVTLTYKFEDNFRIFASYGQGFQSGEFNQNGVGVAAAAVGLHGVQDVTKNVVTTNYEVGFKSLFFDNKLALSGTYFHTDVKNDPWFTFIPSIDAQILIGIDEVKINGGEFESQLNLGRFSANLGVGVTDAKIAKYSLDPSLVGDWAPYVPNVTTSVGFQYSLLLPDSLSLVPRVDYELRGHQYWDPENNTARRALNLVNARLTLAKTDAGLEAAAFVKNLTNLRYNEEWVAGGYAFPANPRTYGVSLRYKF